MSGSLYQVWRLDCDCGNVTDFEEDHPGEDVECELCGLPANDEPDEFADRVEGE